MSAFASKFKLERGIGVDEWRLAEPLVYQSDLLFLAKLEDLITVPEGFVTDFASIPRVFHRLLPKNGSYDAAAVVHDYLYATGLYSKDMADRVFLEAMEAIGVPWMTRKTMYHAVKWGGFLAWNGHRKNDRTRKTTSDELSNVRSEIEPEAESETDLRA